MQWSMTKVLLGVVLVKIPLRSNNPIFLRFHFFLYKPINYCMITHFRIVRSTTAEQFWSIREDDINQTLCDTCSLHLNSSW